MKSKNTLALLAVMGILVISGCSSASVPAPKQVPIPNPEQKQEESKQEANIPKADASSEAEEQKATTPEKIAERTVKLFYYNPEKDKDSTGNLLCTSKGLVAVTRTIPVTKTPIQDTLKLLLKGEITPAEKAQGVTSEYPLPGLKLTGVSLKNGKLTLSLDDPQGKTNGGSCRAGILWAQIKGTAMQFPEVTSVGLATEFLFQP
ncbi:MAG: GerMN domain-containing protein [Candidatus Gracilibacteria bacterium]|nr:GerMN domain-containing protein [Candidatus Gracilibacteria bacterium]